MRLRLLVVTGLLVASCVPQQSQPSQTPTDRPTDARPRFELASYMYALQTKGKIRIGVLGKEPPFATSDPSGARGGFEIDLGRELAQAIFGPQRNPDAVIEWIAVDRTTAVSSLTTAQTDVVLARLAVTPELAAAVDLSDPYFVTGERILIRSTNDEIKDLPDLDGKTVCVTQGTSVGDDVDEANAFAKTLALDTYASCLQALQKGQVDAIAADEPTLWDLSKQDQNTRLVGRRVTTERYAIGAKKSASNDREGFIGFLNSWLVTQIVIGTWGRLYEKDISPISQDRRSTPD